MQLISELHSAIAAHFKQYAFVVGADFRWSPTQTTVFHPPIVHYEDIWDLLHEVAHAELGHRSFNADIELISHEAAAWEYAAQVLAPIFGVSIGEDYADASLDTYRHWLHTRSLCPDCGQNGLQTQNTYQCLNCRCLWRANDARLCRLQRIRLRDRSVRA